MRRVLLLLSHQENRRLLRDELVESYDVVVGTGEGDLEQEFDVCLLDGPALERLRERVLTRKTREQPIFLPVLLVTSRPDVRMTTGEVWRCVDELIVTPIDRPELRARMEILMRVRELSLALRQRANEAERAAAAALDANRAKSEFLAVMSHELRTPINAITGYTDLLELGISGPLTDRQATQLGRIKFSSEHLLALVNEVLNLAKVESGRLEVEAERVLVKDTVRQAIDLTAPLAAGREVQLIDQVGEDRDTAYWGDASRVRQILANLISNGVKFTEPGGRVSVALHRVTEHPGHSVSLSGAGPWVALMVQDTGIGIALEQQEAVFEPFMQVDSSHTRERGGTGLGLTISRRLARLMGGDLTVRSARGRGACFTLWLPAAPPVGGSGSAPGDTSARVPRLSEVGRVLARCADDIVAGVAERLRHDPATPGARTLDRARLDNHLATLLVDLGLALGALEDGGGDPTQIRDGTEIQRTIADLHGAQRARLAWSVDALRHEFGVLREVTVRTLRRTLPDGASETLNEVLTIVTRLLDQAERVGLQGWSRAERERP